jgi:hypothetical protein
MKADVEVTRNYFNSGRDAIISKWPPVGSHHEEDVYLNRSRILYSCLPTGYFQISQSVT